MGTKMERTDSKCQQWNRIGEGLLAVVDDEQEILVASR